MTFIDEMSGYISVVPIKSKADVAGGFRAYMVWFQRSAECELKRLHSDNGGEYIAPEPFLKENGIEYTMPSPYTPQENGIAERCNRTVMESTPSMLVHAVLPLAFWAEAAVHAADIRNRFLCPENDTVTSLELVTGRKPRVAHLRVFCGHARVHIPTQKRRKLEEKSEEGLLIVCRDNSQYKLWQRHHKEAVFSRDVMIDETRFPSFEWFSSDEDPVLFPTELSTPRRTITVQLPTTEELQNLGNEEEQREVEDGEQESVAPVQPVL